MVKLQKAFNRQSGFSARNLWNMRQFHCEYHDPENLQQAVADFP